MSTIDFTPSLTGELFVDVATQTPSEEELSTAKKTNDVALRAMKAKIVVALYAAGLIALPVLAIRADENRGGAESKILLGLFVLCAIAAAYTELVKVYNDILQEPLKKEGK